MRKKLDLLWDCLQALFMIIFVLPIILLTHKKEDAWVLETLEEWIDDEEY